MLQLRYALTLSVVACVYTSICRSVCMRSVVCQHSTRYRVGLCRYVYPWLYIQRIHLLLLWYIYLIVFTIHISIFSVLFNFLVFLDAAPSLSRSFNTQSQIHMQTKKLCMFFFSFCVYYASVSSASIQNNSIGHCYVEAGVRSFLFLQYNNFLQYRQTCKYSVT